MAEEVAKWPGLVEEVAEGVVDIMRDCCAIRVEIAGDVAVVVVARNEKLMSGGVGSLMFDV